MNPIQLGGPLAPSTFGLPVLLIIGVAGLVVISAGILLRVQADALGSDEPIGGHTIISSDDSVLQRAPRWTLLDCAHEIQLTLAVSGVSLLLSAVAVTVSTPPAAGYEISVYDSFPWYFWAFVVGSFLTGILTILAGAFDESGDDRVWVSGVVTVLMLDALLLLMPYIRGYPMYGRGDSMSHLGFIHVITETGVASSGNIYPNLHLLTRILAYAAGQEPMSVLTAVTPLVTMIYFGSMFLLLKHLFGTRGTVLAGLTLALLPAYGLTHLATAPYRVSLLFAPFLLYLFVREQQTGSVVVRAALVVVIVAFVIYHPLTPIFLLGVFLVRALVLRTNVFDVEQATPTTIASLMAVIFAGWYLDFTGMVLRFQNVFEVLVGETTGGAPIDQASETVSRTSPELVDLVRIATFSYGLSAALVGLGFGFLVLATFLWWRGRYDPTVFTVVFAISLVAFTVGSAGFLLLDLIVPLWRPLQFTQILAVLLGGGFIYLLGRYVKDRRFGLGYDYALSVSLVLLVALLVTLSTFTLFASPLSSEVNHQVTEMELDGSEWVFENQADGREIEEFGIRQWRFHSALYGDADVDGVRITGSRAPDHFNYSTHPYYGMSYSEDQYLILNRLGRITYQEKFPNYREFWRFTPQDFDRLERDPTVNRLYDNGEFTAYGVQAESPVQSQPGASADVS